MDQTKLKQYEDWKFAVSAYEMALAIIDIDKQTVAPVDGAEYRDQRTAFLSGELFSRKTDPEMVSIIKSMKNDESLDGDTRREAELYSRDLEKVVSVPKKEYVAYQQLVSESYEIWHKAKLQADYSLFEPYLRRLVEETKKLYGYRSSSASIYDQMLNDFEPGFDQKWYDSFFEMTKERLIPLIKKVTEAEPIDTSFLYLDYPVEKQKQWTEEVLLPYLGFTKNWGYQNETEHPFTSWTCENDCRTTTKYLKDNVISSIFSTIHETGHAWYMHDISPAYDGSILSFGVYSGMHESQSRFCENYLGRRKSFWEALYPSLQRTFPEQLGSISLDTFVRAVNASVPSCVRTEADELTYPLHIVIRYEIEKGLFNGTIPFARLDEVWNSMYASYLGVHPKDAREGILQDVHWSDGEFGYFPTYALGSAFAAQFFEAMSRDMDVDEALSNGHYTACIDWLKQHIHKYGARYDAAEMMKIATGKPFDPALYFDYLEQKYTELYHL